MAMRLILADHRNFKVGGPACVKLIMHIITDLLRGGEIDHVI